MVSRNCDEKQGRAAGKSKLTAKVKQMDSQVQEPPPRNSSRFAG